MALNLQRAVRRNRELLGSVGLRGPRDGVGGAQNQKEAHSAQFRKLPCSKGPSPLALGHLLGNVHPGNRDTEPEASQGRWRGLEVCENKI